MIKVLVVDDVTILRECLRIMINKESDMTVVGCAENGKEAVDMALALNPDVVLMDLNMPVYSGHSAIKDIKAAKPDIKILVLTVEEDEKNITTAFINGADGYILKDITPEELAVVIKNAHDGVGCVQERAFNLGNYPSGRTVRQDDYELVCFTAREKEVLRLVVDGLTNEEIADDLGISVGRARNIVADLTSKCFVKNRTQLAVVAVRLNMLA